MTRNVLFPFCLLALALASAACGGSSTASAEPSESAPPAVVVDVPAVRATVKPMQSVLEISGTLTPRVRVGVKPKLPERLDRVLVNIGDRVTAGQVVAVLDRRELDAQVDAARAAVAVAEASLDSTEAALANATTEHTRAQNLFEGGALPRQRLEAAETALRAATAQRNLARANLAQAEAALRRALELQKDATLTAPVSGFIVERNYDAGAMPGDLPVVVVADLRELKLEAGLSELQAGRVRTGLPAHVTVQARPGETYSGQLAAIAPEVTAQNRHFQVEVRVDNAKGDLLAGMYATAQIVVEEVNDALTIPREAVTTQNGQRVAFKIVGDALEPVPVVEGLTDGQDVQVISGLAPGDQVLADARRQYPAGSRVKAVEVR
jgi:RND family efflux transporter MFP subunit